MPPRVNFFDDDDPIPSKGKSDNKSRRERERKKQERRNQPDTAQQRQRATALAEAERTALADAEAARLRAEALAAARQRERAEAINKAVAAIKERETAFKQLTRQRPLPLAPESRKQKVEVEQGEEGGEGHEGQEGEKGEEEQSSTGEWYLTVSKRQTFTDYQGLQRDMSEDFTGTKDDLLALIAKTKAAIIIRHMNMCIQSDPRMHYFVNNYLLQNAYYALLAVQSAYRNAVPVVSTAANPAYMLQHNANKILLDGTNAAAATMLRAGVAAIDSAYTDYFGHNGDYHFFLRKVTTTST